MAWYPPKLQGRREHCACIRLLATAPAALSDLVRVPFNLRLMADIVHGGINIAELRPIRTQSKLLRRFWQYRVLGASDADLRERVIQQFLGELGAELGDMEPLIAALNHPMPILDNESKLFFAILLVH